MQLKASQTQLSKVLLIPVLSYSLRDTFNCLAIKTRGREGERKRERLMRPERSRERPECRAVCVVMSYVMTCYSVCIYNRQHRHYEVSRFWLSPSPETIAKNKAKPCSDWSEAIEDWVRAEASKRSVSLELKPKTLTNIENWKCIQSFHYWKGVYEKCLRRKDVKLAIFKWYFLFWAIILNNAQCQTSAKPSANHAIHCRPV